MTNLEWTPTTVLEAILSAEPVKDRGYYFAEDDQNTRFYSFQDMIARARRRGSELQALGLKQGDRVALIIPDNDEFVVSFLGALMAGVLPVPLYPPFSLGKLDAYLKGTAQIIAAAGATVLLTTRRVQSILWPVTDIARCLRELITVEKISSSEPFKFTPASLGPDDPAFLQFTSGSTAQPKGVVVTHRSLVANCLSITREGTQAHPYDDKGLSWLPLYHDMGLIGFVIAPLFVPLSVVLVPTLSFMKRPLLWFELIHQHRATITFAPNFAYSLLTRRATDAQLDKWDLSRVRVSGCGAEPISPDIMRGFLERFARAGLKPEVMLPCYGMAEATLAITFKPLGTLWRTDVIDGLRFREEGRAAPVAADVEDRLEFVSCGRPTVGHHIRILDEAGDPLPEREVGEIEFLGPSVTAGYYGNEPATLEAFVQGAIRTGDLGYLADGDLYVTGRKKDLIIIRGRNYVPQAIEWMVEEVSGVRRGNVVAFARPGERGSEELVVVCEVKSDDLEALRKTITAHLTAELGITPADVVFLPQGALPKTTSGKLQRRKTLEKYADGTLGQDGIRTQGQTGHALQLTGHVMRAMLSRVRHTVRRTLGSDP